MASLVDCTDGHVEFMLVFKRDRRAVRVNDVGEVVPLIKFFARYFAFLTGYDQISTVLFDLLNYPAVDCDLSGLPVFVIPDFFNSAGCGRYANVLFIFGFIVIIFKVMTDAMLIHHGFNVAVTVICDLW